MIHLIQEWLLQKIYQNTKLRSYFQERLLATHPLFSSPQMRFASPGHFYSPLPDLFEVEAEAIRIYNTQSSSENGIKLNIEAQRQLLIDITRYFSSFDWNEEPASGKRFWLNNSYFGHGDALILYAMIRHFKPRRIIEVGSGFSSALMLDINDLYCNPRMQICFIEPYPDRLENLRTPADRESAQLITSPVQKVSLDEFDRLDRNDILFIDSSHVSKAGSDVNHLFFEILPRLRSGVLIHVHDIFYPFEYPLEWLREGRAWNEVYLLRAFLQYNPSFEIVFFNNYIGQQFNDYLTAHVPLMIINPGVSIWLRKN